MAHLNPHPLVLAATLLLSLPTAAPLPHEHGATGHHCIPRSPRIMFASGDGDHVLVAAACTPERDPPPLLV